jgi:hypothetical protein
LYYFPFQAEIQAYLSAHSITSHGTNIPNPILSFEEANFAGNSLTIVNKECLLVVINYPGTSFSDGNPGIL